jgi:hypothetical protein
MSSREASFWGITVKSAVVHTVTYVVVGILASNIFNYASLLAEPGYSSFMRPMSDPMVAAGPLFQPIRGVLFGIVFYLLRDVLFARPNGWLICWVTLVIIGIFSTFGPAPGSIEGIVYTTFSLTRQLGGLVEILVQSLFLSTVLFYWVNHREKRWLSWTLGVLFALAILLPTLGLLFGGRAAA